MTTRCVRFSILAVTSAVALAVAVAANAGTPSTTAPLVPRSLSSLQTAPSTLLELDRSQARSAAPALRAAGAVEVSRRFGVWRVRRALARTLIPRLATAGALREFEPDRVVAASGALAAAGGGLPPETWWRA